MASELAAPHPRRLAAAPLAESDLALAAALYAATCTLALLLWPGGIVTRYAMPGTLGLAVLLGLVFDRCRTSRPRVAAAAVGVASAIAAYVVILGWIAMPLAYDAFNPSRIAANAINAARQGIAGPFFTCPSSLDLDVLPYVRGPIREIDCENPRDLTVPAVAALSPADVASLSAARPDLKILPRAVAPKTTMSEVVEIAAGR